MWAGWRSLSDWALSAARQGGPGLSWLAVRCEELTDNNDNNDTRGLINTDGHTRDFPDPGGTGVRVITIACVTAALQTCSIAGENINWLICECHQGYITLALLHIVQWIVLKNKHSWMGKGDKQWMDASDWPQVISHTVTLPAHQTSGISRVQTSGLWEY